MVPQKFRTRLRRRKRNEEQVDYELNLFGKLVNEVLHLSDALLVLTNYATTNVPNLSSHSDVYFLGETEPGNGIHLMFSPRMPSVDSTGPFVADMR